MASTGKIKAFLAEPRNVVVAGIRRDGRPHLSPNWFYWDGQRFYVSTTRGRGKYAIFGRDPRARLLIYTSTRVPPLSGPRHYTDPREYRPGAAPFPRYPGQARDGGTGRRGASAGPDSRGAGPA